MAFLLRSRNSRAFAAPGFGAMIDFVNGTYTVNGEAVTAADVVSDTDRISASGLSILPFGDGVVSLLGAFRDLLFTGNWTILLKFDVLDPENGGVNHNNSFIDMWDSGDSAFFQIQTFDHVLRVWEWDQSVERNISSHGEAVTGVNGLAVTRTPDLLAVSLNGAAADTVATSTSTPVFVTADAAWHNKTTLAGHIRSIEIMSPVGSSSLPALSAI